ncbi:MAG: hypothetical protein MI757_22725, partial [Pirellulales bacterium]|nr:hypothetical protein [Pirellulales bacterium]
GMHELALEYLKDLPNNPLAPRDFIKTAEYEEAATYIDWAGRTRDAKQQESRLAKGEAKLKAFQQANSRHALASSAQMQLGNIALHRARMKRLLSGAKSKSEEEQKTLKAEAIKLFGDANKKFAEAEGQFKAARDKLPKTPKNRDMRNTLRDGMLHSGVSAANSLYEMAKTYEDGSEEQKTTLKKASKVYEGLFTKYQRYLLGLRYRLHQARCLHETNNKEDVEMALMIYSEYEGMPDNAASVRELKLLATAYQVAALATTAISKFDDAFKIGRAKLNSAASTDRKGDAYQTLQMEMALAYEAAAKATKDPQKKKVLVGDAVRLGRTVARAGGSQSLKAKQLVERLQGEPQGPQPEPTNYVEAIRRANQAHGDWQSAHESLAKAKEDGDDKAVADLTKAKAESYAEAQKYYTIAARLADEKTTRDDIAKLRYNLCYLFYANGDFFRAAALGDYVVEMHPKAPAAQKAALLAMQSYKNLFAAAGDGSTAFELARLTSLAEMVAERWPNDSSAESALLTLFNFKIREAYDDNLDLAVRSQKLDEAAVILDKVGDTPNSAIAAIQVGQGYWRQYLLSLQEPDDQRIAEDQLEALADKAKEYLDKGVKSTGEGEVDATVAKAALSLAKILVDDSELTQAAELLEDKHHGPLTLVSANHPVATGRYPIDTYKTALRAYIGSTPQRIDDAKQMLEKLKSSIGSDRQARERLDSELINIGIRLKKQLDNAQLKKDNDAQVKALAKGIQVFLGEIGAANDEYNTLSWVASTFYNLGESFREAAATSKTGKASALSAARQYYRESDKVYRRIFENIAADPGWGPENKLALNVRNANLLIRLKEFDNATKILSGILAEKPAMLSIQVEAAKAYQTWAMDVGTADTKEMDKLLNRALAGHGRMKNDNNKKIVWGWAQLRKLTARDLKKFGKYYHEACYNMAYCLFQQSKLRKGADKKKRADLAAQVIDVAYEADPKMGGSAMYRKYSGLLKSIQAATDKPQVGLKKST